MDFHSAYGQGFLRVAACTLPTVIADPAANADRFCAWHAPVMRTTWGRGVPGVDAVGVLPRGHRHAGHTAQRGAAGPRTVIEGSTDLLPVLVVGAPLRFRHRIYNTAVVIHRGRVLGAVPKSYLPTYREFYERRQMAPGEDERGNHRHRRCEVPFGPDLLFGATDVPGFVLHVEICEDMFVPVPPSAEAALAGATVLANLSGSPITIGRAEDRSLLARSASRALPGRLRLRRRGGG